MAIQANVFYKLCQQTYHHYQRIYLLRPGTHPPRRRRCARWKWREPRVLCVEYLLLPLVINVTNAEKGSK